MILIGFWREYTNVQSDPSIYDETFNIEGINPSVLNYLELKNDKGRIMGPITVSRGGNFDCLLIEGRVHPYGYLSDGEYIWTPVLTAYYRFKNLNLPIDFLKRMESLNYVVPEMAWDKKTIIEEIVNRHFFPHTWNDPFGLGN